MKTFYFGIIALMLIFGCTESKKSTSVNKPISIAVKKEKVVPNSTSILAIEGMVCKMGCGASIRKALNDEGGVANCQIDFEEERKINVLKIKYDSTIITQKKMIQLLSSINDRQFKVAVQ